MIAELNISVTDFIRTTDAHHVAAVQYIWQKLVEAGYIYKGSYEGWYCQGCEAFVTDKEAADNNGVCPDHQTPYQRLVRKIIILKPVLFRTIFVRQLSQIK